MEKLLLIPGLGLLILLLAGCIQLPSSSVGGGETIKYVCSDGTTTVADIASCPPSARVAAARELTQEEELSVCSGMPYTQSMSASFEDICIIGVAGKHSDVLLCKKVSRDQRTTCYTLIAELENDPDICSQAESMTEQCYSQYATDKKDGSICEKISDVSYKDSCYYNLANQLADASLCDKIKTVSQKDSCYFNMASRLGDSSYCDDITNSSQKESCEQNIQGRTEQMKYA